MSITNGSMNQKVSRSNANEFPKIRDDFAVKWIARNCKNNWRISKQQRINRLFVCGTSRLMLSHPWSDQAGKTIMEQHFTNSEGQKLTCNTCQEATNDGCSQGPPRRQESTMTHSPGGDKKTSETHEVGTYYGRNWPPPTQMANFLDTFQRCIPVFPTLLSSQSTLLPLFSVYVAIITSS